MTIGEREALYAELTQLIKDKGEELRATLAKQQGKVSCTAQAGGSDTDDILEEIEKVVDLVVKVLPILIALIGALKR